MAKGAETFARALVVLIAAAATPAWGGPDFKMADTLTCTVEASSTPTEIGRRFIVSGLTSAVPQAVFENYVRSSMPKVFESEKTLVIQLVAAISGSVDTIVIDKTSGRFAHTAAGSFLDVHAIAEVGTCRPD
ncbi:MAG: hypothetical protein MUC33_00705 [Desulfobacterales bacterium]|jgi:hypothetical protein|nr:hypothetical protein [Desulfobacterales bacterium]